MPFFDLSQITTRSPFPGFHGRFIHSNHVTLVYWRVEPGAVLPEHSHPHEQVVNMLEGEFELTINGETRRLREGSVAVIPSNAVHSGVSCAHCRILDVFYPIREDYR